MTNWIRDAVDAAREIRTIRHLGVRGKIVIVLEEDLELQKYETAVDRKQNRLLYQCIEDMAHGKTRCRFCEEYKNCKDERRGNVRGCSDWWLRFLTEQEEMECRGIYEQAAAESPEEDQTAGVPRDDAGTADRGAD